MKSKTKIDKIMNALIGISAMIVMIGAFLKITHYSNANYMLTWGFILLTAFSSIEISRLKKIIKRYELENIKKD